MYIQKYKSEQVLVQVRKYFRNCASTQVHKCTSTVILSLWQKRALSHKNSKRKMQKNAALFYVEI